MYLHLGQSVVVPYGDIIGIFDMDNTTESKRTLDFLSKADREGRVVDVSGDLPKSYALCKSKQGEPMVYLCQLSPTTLLKRVESGIYE